VPFLDISPLELIALLALAVMLFGPDKLPGAVQGLARTLRQFREFTRNAQNDLKKELGPEFQDMELTDLHPKNFVRKHLLDDETGLDDLDPRKFVRKHLLDEPEAGQAGGAPMVEPTPEDATAVAVLPPGESPPYDSEAT
jgi:sec-independent protein translocase protein TatB